MGCPPSKIPGKHTKRPIYRAFIIFSSSQKSNRKCKFPILYFVFWTFILYHHSMLGQEFCPSSFSVLSLQFVLPPVPPPPIFCHFSYIKPIHTNLILQSFKRLSNATIKRPPNKPHRRINAHIQRIYPHTNKKGHTRKRAALHA